MAHDALDSPERWRIEEAEALAAEAAAAAFVLSSSAAEEQTESQRDGGSQTDREPGSDPDRETDTETDTSTGTETDDDAEEIVKVEEIQTDDEDDVDEDFHAMASAVRGVPAQAQGDAPTRSKVARSLQHTTAAAANEVGNARKARLDKIAAERRAASVAQRSSRLLVQSQTRTRRAPPLPPSDARAEAPALNTAREGQPAAGEDSQARLLSLIHAHETAAAVRLQSNYRGHLSRRRHRRPLGGSTGSPAPGSPPSSDGGVGVRAQVKCDYEAEDETNLTIKVGDVVVVTEQSTEDWWEGHVEGAPHRAGFFPGAFVELLEGGGSTGGSPAKVTCDYEAEDDSSI